MGTMDIFLCFFTCHYDYAANRVEMRWERAVRQYLRTWFIPDIIMFSPEWILFLMRAFQRKTLARFGTLLRILKVSKVAHFLQTLESAVSSEYRIAYAKLLRQVFFIV